MISAGAFVPREKKGPPKMNFGLHPPEEANEYIRVGDFLDSSAAGLKGDAGHVVKPLSKRVGILGDDLVHSKTLCNIN